MYWTGKQKLNTNDKIKINPPLVDIAVSQMAITGYIFKNLSSKNVFLVIYAQFSV